MENLQALKDHLAEGRNVSRAAAVLSWDQQTFMPPSGAAARAAQLATLSRIAHELFTSEKTGELLRAAADEVRDLPPESDEAALVRVVQHDYDLQTRVPTALVTELARTRSEANQVWAKARRENDFPAFAPMLERVIDLVRQVAEALGYDDHIYDALLNQYEPHMKTAEVETLFDELRAELVPFAAQIFERLDAVDPGPLQKHYPTAGQQAFGEKVVADLGYDFARGRLDPSVHPFTTGFGPDDVRITTRYQEDWLPASIFASIHEAGHGMHGQGTGALWGNSPLAGSPSLGVSESQSRLWENIIGRSRGFWDYYYPALQATFPEQLDGVSLDDWYRVVNRVTRSLVRVEADEVTYNFHIMLRFEMEKDFVTGALAVKDAPDAWNAKMEQYLGITPPADGTQNILQDIHWSWGMLGYFPTYSLGNFLSVQLWDKALSEQPSLPDDIAQGRFAPLLDWMRTHVYAQGRKLWPQELVQQVTGEPLQVRSFVRYIKDKYTPIYGLS